MRIVEMLADFYQAMTLKGVFLDNVQHNIDL